MSALNELQPRTAQAPDNCLDCQHHQVITDRDPDDWFCDDDKAVVCDRTPNDKLDLASRYASRQHPSRAVSVAVRPYKLREESGRPEWCPLLAGVSR